MKINKNIDIDFTNIFLLGIGIHKARALYFGWIIDIYFIFWRISFHSETFSHNNTVIGGGK